MARTMESEEACAIWDGGAPDAPQRENSSYAQPTGFEQAANISLLHTLTAHEKHVMLCYIAGFNPDVFAYGVRAMLAEQGGKTEAEHRG